MKQPAEGPKEGKGQGGQRVNVWALALLKKISVGLGEKGAETEGVWWPKDQSRFL